MDITGQNGFPSGYSFTKQMYNESVGGQKSSLRFEQTPYAVMLT